MTTATQVLAYEATAISKPGDNNGAWVWHALGYPVYGAWCGAFQLLSLKTNGVDRPTSTDLRMIYVPYIQQDAKKAGRWITSRNSKPGDLVIFDWSGRETGADHVGMILENDPTKPYVKTREGNAGAASNGQRCVQDHVRYRTSISGCVNMQGSYTKPVPPKPVAPTKDDTWVAGPNVIKALQKHFGTTQDGVISSQDIGRRANFPGATWTTIQWVATNRADGSKLVAAVQRSLGLKADGLLGPATAKALQKWAGTTQDGICGTKTVQAIATKLGVK